MSKSEREALCKLARDCFQLQQTKMAKELFEKAIAIDIDCAEAYDGLAAIAYLSSDFPSAIAHYVKLNLLQPTEAKNYTNLGAIYNQTGEYTKAVDVLRKAIQRDKRCAEAYFNLGIAQRKLKQYQMAISAYREAARLNPKLAEAYQNLGNVYMEMANLQMAVINYKKALEIKPDFQNARLGLEKAQAAANSVKQAANPFGRLVNTEAYQTNAQAASMRELTDTERYEDRHEVKQICDEIERLTKSKIEFIKQKLEPSILELQRTVTEGDKAQIPLADVADEYHAAMNQFAELRKSLKRKVLELRAHEELINAPEVSL